MGKKTNGARPPAKAHLAHTGSTNPDLDHAEPDRRIGARTLGPVSDLERHLPSDWWRTLFNSLYLETDGDIIENDRNTADEVDLLIRSVGLERNDRILDLCCGQGRHSLELASRGFPNVTGLDRSRYLFTLCCHHFGNSAIFRVYHVYDLERGCEIDRGGTRVAALRFARVQHQCVAERREGRRATSKLTRRLALIARQLGA